ncbi:MAG: F0F1 ATP synthase subunit epsilon [Actinomycetes bacterium]|jgi:F-type H+-transporting ATPase subunit epsilon
MSELNVSVVAVDRSVWVGTAKSIVAKTPEGEIGILPGHEPVLSLLVNGVVRIEPTEGANVAIAVHGGFVAVDSDNVRVLAETAELASDIDLDRAQTALTRVQGVETPEAMAALHRAETRIKAAAAVTSQGLHS